MFGDPVTNPMGWEFNSLGCIAECFIGLTYKPDDVNETGIIVLRSGNIQNGELDFTDLVRVTTDIKEKLYVHKDDILMCSRNGSAQLVGKVAIISELSETMTFGAFMTIIRSKNSHYLLSFFRSNAFFEQITTAKTSTVNQITKSMLDVIRVSLPPLSFQNRFAEFVKQADKSSFRADGTGDFQVMVR
jgi:type I restriction enzyme S subunit